jgi:hypothetical protein
MSSSGTAEYTSIEDIRALYLWMSIPNAQLLYSMMEAVIDHGRTDPDGVTEMEDRRLWLSEAHIRLVRPSAPQVRASRAGNKIGCSASIGIQT